MASRRYSSSVRFLPNRRDLPLRLTRLQRDACVEQSIGVFEHRVLDQPGHLVLPLIFDSSVERQLAVDRHRVVRAAGEAELRRARAVDYPTGRCLPSR